MDDIRPVLWKGDAVEILDQRRLPGETIANVYRDADEVARSITDMEVRGAPAIGCAAAFGLALAAAKDDAAFTEAAERMRRARPTAVNLMWAVDRMLERRRVAVEAGEDLLEALVAEAVEIAREDEEMCRAIGRHGAPLAPRGARILTHCNAGALATSTYGTALGVIRAAHAADPTVKVWVDETRPYLQGARLTAWELHHDGIPCTLVTDNMAGHLMSRGKVDMVVTGADRIARNGDVANKIGTYSLAVLCQYHRIPFYVAAPSSTFDPATLSGEAIPIEERSSQEVVRIGDVAIAPEGVEAAHPAFDVTPAHLITGIVTELGVLSAPYWRSIPRALGWEDKTPAQGLQLGAAEG